MKIGVKRGLLFQMNCKKVSQNVTNALSSTHDKRGTFTSLRFLLKEVRLKYCFNRVELLNQLSGFFPYLLMLPQWPFKSQLP